MIILREVVITAAVRTPVGKYGGSLKTVSVDDLSALVIREVVKRSNLEGGEVNEVVLGWGNQAGKQQNLARIALLKARLPEQVPGYTVQRNCGSGMQAVISAVHAIQTENAEVCIAAGVENMSMWPYVMEKPTTLPQTTPPEFYDTTGFTGKTYSQPVEMYGRFSMGITAENIAEKYGISRQEQDEFALFSHQKAVNAIKQGKFAEEIIPVAIRVKKGESVMFTTDEGPREDTNLQKLAALPTGFKEGGSVTAGNSCPLNDGAAALVLMSGEKARSLGLEPLARFRAEGVAGVDPRYMGIGPVPATRKALQKSGLSTDQIDVVELNEAFAAQSLAVLKELEFDTTRVNPNGGAISLGHPIGATGVKIITTLIYELKRRNGRYGLATMCIGGGQGITVVVERPIK